MRSLSSALAVLAVALAACGGSSNPTTPSNPGTPGTPGTPGGSTCTGTGGAVSVVDNAFNPTCMQVNPGSNVTWTFQGTGHNVTFGNAALGSSGNQAFGATYTKAFPSAGTFAYSCTNHPGMNGEVRVQ